MLGQEHQTQGLPGVVLAQDQVSVLGSFSGSPVQLYQPARGSHELFGEARENAFQIPLDGTAPWQIWEWTGLADSERHKASSPSQRMAFSAELWLFVLILLLGWNCLLKARQAFVPKVLPSPSASQARRLVLPALGTQTEIGQGYSIPLEVMPWVTSGKVEEKNFGWCLILTLQLCSEFSKKLLFNQTPCSLIQANFSWENRFHEATKWHCCPLRVDLREGTELLLQSCKPGCSLCYWSKAVRPSTSSFQ